MTCSSKSSMSLFNVNVSLEPSWITPSSISGPSSLLSLLEFSSWHLLPLNWLYNFLAVLGFELRALCLQVLYHLNHVPSSPPPFFFLVLGLELRAFTLSHSTNPIFVKGFLRYGLLEVVAWAGFEPQSS
jgi:hypothetical protein